MVFYLIFYNLLGFPDCSYGFKNIVNPLINQGYRLIIPDQRGYGLSSAPRDPKKYHMKLLIQDNINLLNTLKIEKVILIGHDWGGSLVWNFVIHYPERVLGVCSICTPFFATNPNKNPWKNMLKNPGRFDYQIYFQTDEAEKALNQNPRATITSFFNEWQNIGLLETPSKNSSLSFDVRKDSFLNEEEIEFYISNWKQNKAGSFGPLCWYRNIEDNWKWNCSKINETVTCPSLMICAENDLILPPSMVETTDMKSSFVDLSVITIKNVGHWVLHQKPDRVTEILLPWLKTKFNSKSKL